eukprot:gene10740-biopygen6532
MGRGGGACPERISRSPGVRHNRCRFAQGQGGNNNDNDDKIRHRWSVPSGRTRVLFRFSGPLAHHNESGSGSASGSGAAARRIDSGQVQVQPQQRATVSQAKDAFGLSLWIVIYNTVGRRTVTRMILQTFARCCGARRLRGALRPPRALYLRRYVVGK